MRAHPTFNHALQAHLDAGAQLVWRGRSGSHAYGLASANSDLDERGIIVWPDRAFADLESPPEQLSELAAIIRSADRCQSGRTGVDLHPGGLRA
jgi:hypothetical protein